VDIIRTDTDEQTSWTGTIDGVEVASLTVWVDTGEIYNVWTVGRYRLEGRARALYERAKADSEGRIYHPLYDHRTDREGGRAFVDAVGGETIDGAVARLMGDCPCENCRRLRGKPG
jgi:hypothetical protein